MEEYKVGRNDKEEEDEGGDNDGKSDNEERDTISTAMDKQGTPGRKKSRTEDTDDGDDTSHISAVFTRHQVTTLIQQTI